MIGCILMMVDRIKESEDAEMRTETYLVTKTYYEYRELSNEAKENVKEMMLSWRSEDADIFAANCKDYLSELFPNSELEVQFSLNSCQGDGLNIYGKLCLNDILKYIKGEFTHNEIRFLNWSLNWADNFYEMEENRHYCYCICDGQDYMENIESELYRDNMRYGDKQIEIMRKFNRLAGDYLSSLCKDLENDGYDFFYEISEEEVIDSCDTNGYEFFEDGTLAG